MGGGVGVNLALHRNTKQIKQLTNMCIWVWGLGRGVDCDWTAAASLFPITAITAPTDLSESSFQIADIGTSLERGGFSGFRVISISRFIVVIILRSETNFLRLLSRRTWRANGHQMYLSKWDPLLEDKRDSPMVLVWVTLKHIPFFLTSAQSLFSVVKTLGKPIQMDETTARGGYFNTARVLVEMDASKARQSSILVRTPAWEREIKIIYDLPPFCLACGRWGHCCKTDSQPVGKVLTGGRTEGRLQAAKEVSQLQDYKLKLGMTNASSHLNNQLWIFWKEPSLTLIQTIECTQIIHCQFNSAALHSPLWISSVYGRHTRAERANLWNAISSWNVGMDPWILGGDFNCIHSLDQHKGNCNPCYKSVEDFRECMEASNLLYIHPSGGHFSWSGKRSQGKLWRRLDHIFGNQHLMDRANRVHLSMLRKGASDHRPFLLELSMNTYSGPKPFRFLDLWVSHHTLESTIKSFWENNKTYNGMKGLGRKLKDLKAILTKWSKDDFGNIFHQLKEAESRASRAQDHFEANPNPESLVEFNKSNAELLLLSKRETDFWRQKSCIRWLKEGDASAKFFHNVVKNRRQKLRISSLKDDHGRTIEEASNIALHAIDYYTNIYSDEPVSIDPQLLSYIPNIINGEDNLMLCAVPQEEEIRGAIWDLNSHSAPGPDGYNGTFFKTYWHIIHDEVTRATQEFFLGLPIPKSYGATLLTLIPKVDNPKSLGDYRPISLSTFLSKVNTKILANRLGSLLHKLISPEQSGFQAGKGVEENILLTQEMIHCLDNTSGSANIAIKVDFAKAFDRISWQFLEATLSSFGGLGIRHLEDVEAAYSTKLWWKIRNSQGLWGEYMRRRYRPDSFQERPTDTVTWKRAARIHNWALQHVQEVDETDTWEGEPFTTKLAYHAWRDSKPISLAHKMIWNKLQIPKISLFMWKAFNNILPFPENLSRFNLALPSQCSFCLNGPQDLNHTLLQCQMSFRIWRFFSALFDGPIRSREDTLHDTCMKSWISTPRNKLQDKITSVLPGFIAWGLWKAHNEVKYAGKAFKEGTIIATIMKTIQQWIWIHKGKQWMHMDETLKSLGFRLHFNRNNSQCFSVFKPSSSTPPLNHPAAQVSSSHPPPLRHLQQPPPQRKPRYEGISPLPPYSSVLVPRHDIKRSFAHVIGSSPLPPINPYPPKPSPNTKVLEQIGFRNSYSVGVLAPSHVLLTFSNAEDYQQCFSKRIWQIQGCPMHVFKWSPEFHCDEESPIFPVWITLEHLPIHFHDPLALHAIAKIFGTPLMLDAATSSRTRPSAARFCVELDVTKELPAKFFLDNGGKGLWQQVTYEQLPQYCVDCQSQATHQGTVPRAKLQFLWLNPPLQHPKQVLFWNVRGIPSSQDRLHQLSHSHNVKLLGILEPMIPSTQLTSIGYQLNLHKHLHGLSNKAWFLWDPNHFTLVNHYEQNQVLHGQFTHILTSNTFWLSIVYGLHSRTARLPLWNSLRAHSSSHNLPWIVGGDFNCITSPNEHRGNAPPCYPSIEDFNSCILDCNLIQPHHDGPLYTWSGKRSNGMVSRTLDRFLLNPKADSIFPNTHYSILNKTTSDHNPILLQFSYQPRNTPKPFRFLNLWTTHSSYTTTVKATWEATHTGRGMHGLYLKLKATQTSLSKWSKDTFGNFFTAVKFAEEACTRAEADYESNPNDYTRSLWGEAKAHLLKSIHTEEAYWRQKANAKWISQGDANTSFFHAACRARWRKQHIHSILNKHGNLISKEIDILEAATHYYADLYSHHPTTNMEAILQHIPCTITEAQNTALCRLPSIEEVKNAVWVLDPNSCAGPDGFNGTFYRQTWDIIQADVCSAIQESFLGIIPPKAMRKSNMVLIPKKDSPTTFSDFRPISLTNFSSKIITRILASRLTTLLPCIISMEQGGFVPGKDINDHTLLARELIHLIDRKTEGGNLALKLDITKAFDTISWDYISQCLNRFGFNQKFTSLVMNSIQHSIISTLVNGTPSKPFNPRRGVRQGDPLSPYIFIIAMEGFTRSLNKLVSTGHLTGFNTGRIQMVNHLSYADDVLVFTNGSIHNLKKLKNFLSNFEESTGLHLNLTKSQIISPKPSSNHAKRQKDCLGMKLASLPVTYLGTPIYKGINRVKYCQDLLSKIDNKLSSWKMHTLSQAGRLTLIKHVLSTLPLHTMSSSKLPEGVLTMIERKLCHFFWGKTDDHTKHAWISWKKICTPTTEGGLGIPNLHTLQQSLGCKLWWKYHFTSSPWVSFLKQSYHRSGNFTTTLIDSPIWKRICQTNDFCVENSTLNNESLEWNLGDNGSFSLKEVTAKLHGPEPSLLTARIPWPKKCIPKASLFLWKTLNGATPFANNLVKLGYNLPSMCLLCERDLETNLHCLMQCPKASYIWNTLGGMLQMPVITNSSFQHNLIMWWLSSAPADPLYHLKPNIPSIITWELWKTYNRIKLGGDHFLPGKTLEIIKHTLNAWSLAHKGIPMPRTLRRIPSKPFKLVRWIPPNRYQYKLNVDGSMNRNGCGGGAVLRDHQGNFLHAIAFPLPFTSPATTETLAMAQALSIYTFPNMIVETDSMELINNVRGISNSNALTSIRFNLQVSNHHLTHTLREANGVADLLAKLGSSCSQRSKISVAKSLLKNALKAQVEYLAKEVAKLTKMKLNELQGSDREEDVSSSGTMKPKANEGSDFKVDIPTFEGKNDPDEFLKWLETVERVFDFKDVSDEKKVKIVALKFRKYASTWWTNTCTKRRRNDKEPMSTWVKMRSLLKKKFLPAEYVRENFAKLQTLRQGSKSVEEYNREFEELLLRCDLQEDDEQTFVRYLFGLNLQIANTVELQSYDSLEELTKLALKVEAQHKKSKAFFSKNNTPSPRPYSSTSKPPYPSSKLPYTTPKNPTTAHSTNPSSSSPSTSRNPSSSFTPRADPTKKAPELYKEDEDFKDTYSKCLIRPYGDFLVKDGYLFRGNQLCVPKCTVV
ncbi:unnamed protein product [Cuscuta campestris]|uniref:Reverse transcriptase domain-containing protein n=1 Tax=Cuscuta campestris TaxID=132261 RepID=A0A484LVQ5_9ASTE|nr:unnamed protein product [Cuscuta campestris]